MVYVADACAAITAKPRPASIFFIRYLESKVRLRNSIGAALICWAVLVPTHSAAKQGQAPATLTVTTTGTRHTQDAQGSKKRGQQHGSPLAKRWNWRWSRWSGTRGDDNDIRCGAGQSIAIGGCCSAIVGGTVYHANQGERAGGATARYHRSIALRRAAQVVLLQGSCTGVRQAESETGTTVTCGSKGQHRSSRHTNINNPRFESQIYATVPVSRPLLAGPRRRIPGVVHEYKLTIRIAATVNTSPTGGGNRSWRLRHTGKQHVRLAGHQCDIQVRNGIGLKDRHSFSRLHCAGVHLWSRCLLSDWVPFINIKFKGKGHPLWIYTYLEGLQLCGQSRRHDGLTIGGRIGQTKGRYGRTPVPSRRCINTLSIDRRCSQCHRQG